jgi:hypothetical protein
MHSHLIYCRLDLPVYETKRDLEQTLMLVRSSLPVPH